MAIINGVQCFILVLEFSLSVCPNCSPSQSYFVTLFNSLLSNCLLYRRSRLHGWYLCLSIYKTCMQSVLFSAVGTLFDLFRPLLHCLSHFRPLSAVEWETESPFCSQLPSSSKGLNVNANINAFDCYLCKNTPKTFLPRQWGDGMTFWLNASLHWQCNILCRHLKFCVLNLSNL